MAPIGRRLGTKQAAVVKVASIQFEVRAATLENRLVLAFIFMPGDLPLFGLVRRICGCFVVDLVLISRILQRQERFSGLRVVAPSFSETSATLISNGHLGCETPTARPNATDAMP